MSIFVTPMNHVSGLQVIVNIDQDDYVPQSGDIAGLRVIVLSQNQIAFPEDEGITVSPGFSTSIGLKMVGIWDSEIAMRNKNTS